MKRFWLLLLIAGLIGSMVSAAAAQPSVAPIGTNLGGVVSWNTAWPFVDVFKTSRPWISQRPGQPWGQGGELNLTPEGWVASLDGDQYAETIMMDEMELFPQGDYLVLYEGDGEIAFGLNSVQVISQQPGRIVIRPNGDAGVYLQIRETNPTDPIRNIRVIMPGFEDVYQTQPFHPVFLERLAGFEVLRFMDWMDTNNSEISSWDQRTTPQSSSQMREGGVALEYMILLANTLQIDPWFTLPHMADDTYVRNFATMVRDNLSPNLKAHIEYSNETWNGQFQQYRYVNDMGIALGLHDSEGLAGLRYHARRATEIFAIWENVFGGSDRLVRVLAAQSANPWTGEQIMDFENAYQKADVLAIAPYFGKTIGPDDVAMVLAMSPQQVVDWALTDMRDRTTQNVIDNKTNAAARGLALHAYEGGQHLVGKNGAENNDDLTALLHATNRHPAMYDAYMEYLTMWSTESGGLFANFSFVGRYSKWGSWGVLEHITQDIQTAPKYRALMDMIGVTSDSYPTNLWIGGHAYSGPFLPTFNWSHRANANGSTAGTAYSIYLQTSGGQFIMMETYPANDICNGSVCSVTVNDPLPYWGLTNASYQWWVGAVMPDGSTRWSNAPSYYPSTFTLMLPPAAAPQNIAAAPNSGQPTLTWDDDPATMWVQVWIGPNPAFGEYFTWAGNAANDTFGSPAYTCAGNTCTLEVAHDHPSGTYQVWMQAWGPGGTSDWVQGADLTVDLDPTGIPTALAVSDPAAANPEFAWTSGAGATWYELVLGPDDASWTWSIGWFPAADLGCEEAGQTCTYIEPGLAGGLLPDGAYVMQVRAWGLGGMTDYASAEFDYTGGA